jgi:hypothetical protein
MASSAVISVPAGSSVVCCPEGEAKDPSDPSSPNLLVVSSATGLGYRVDHAAGALAPGAEPVDLSSSALFSDPAKAPTEEYRRAAVAALQGWVGKAYAPHLLGAAVAAKGAEVFHNPGAANSLVVVTSVAVTNLKNFWAGSLRGRYVVTFPEGGEGGGGGGGGGAAAGGASVSGSLRIVTHYFEGGNVQMRDGKEVKGARIAFDSPASFAAALVKLVAGAEDGVLAGLDGTYEALSGAALKEVRRALPVSGSKFSWNIAGHRMVRALGQGGGGGEGK